MRRRKRCSETERSRARKKVIVAEKGCTKRSQTIKTLEAGLGRGEQAAISRARLGEVAHEDHNEDGEKKCVTRQWRAGMRGNGQLRGA